MSPPLLPQDITMTSETEETVLDLVARLRRKEGLTVCPYDRRSPDYWTTSDTDPCKYCGQKNEDDAPNVCKGVDLRVMDEAADKIVAMSAQLAALSRAPGAEDLQAQLEAAEQDIHELTKALTGLTVGGSEFFVPKRGRYVADIKFCVDHVKDRERRQHKLIIDAIQRAHKAEKELAALSPPSTGGEGEAVAWSCRDLITGQVSITDDREHAMLRAGHVDAWMVQPLYLPPSPEMGEISREEWEAILNKALRLQVDTLIGEICALVPQNYGGWDYHGSHWTDRIAKRATDEILRLKENGLSREGLGGSARAGSGAAGPSDCAEGDARLSDGEGA